MGQLAPDWWMHGVRWSGVRNAPFREASRREVEPEVGRRAEPHVIKGGRARGSLSGPEALSAIFLVHARPCLPGTPILLPFAWFLRSWSCEWPVGGDADGRRSSAGGLVDLRVRTRGAGEGSPTTWEAGTRRDHTVGRGRGTRRPLKGGLLLLFLYACCGAVSL